MYTLKTQLTRIKTMYAKKIYESRTNSLIFYNRMLRQKIRLGNIQKLRWQYSEAKMGSSTSKSLYIESNNQILLYTMRHFVSFPTRVQTLTTIFSLAQAKTW